MDMKMFLSFINNESLAPIIRICTWHLLHVKKIVASTISSYLIRDFLNVVQSLNHVQLFATPSNAAHQASQSFTTSQSLLKLMSIESVMLSVSSSTPPFSSSCPESFPPSVFSSELALCTKWPKYWSFSISLSNDYSLLLYYFLYFLYLKYVHGTTEVTPYTENFKKASSATCPTK